MSGVLLVLTVCCLAAPQLASSLSYKGYQVFKVLPKTIAQVQALQKASDILGEGVSLWESSVLPHHPALIHASPAALGKLITYLRRHSMQERLVIKDVDAAIKLQVANRHPVTPPHAADFALDQYHPLEEIQAYIFAIAQNYSSVARIITLGYSYEGQPIYALRVSTDFSANKPVLWLDSAMHAREWVAPASMLYFINQFMQSYTTDPVLVASLETYDWHFLPVFNVDGYRYTWEPNGDRMWRKTRTDNLDSPCKGADPNRNWDIAWGTVGVSHLPCSDQYCGTAPFSEPCVRAVADYLASNVSVAMYFAYHSYSQFFMLPYGYTTTPTPDYPEMMTLCQQGAQKTQAVHGMFYECNSLVNLVGPNSGSSIDYTYGVLGVKYSFGVELRDTGEYGFLLPPDQIIPTAEENIPFVMNVVEYILANTSQI